MLITMESLSEDSSRYGDCTNPDDDSIFRPRRSTILAKMLKYNYDAAPANTTGSSTKTMLRQLLEESCPKEDQESYRLGFLRSFEDKELQEI